MMRVRSFGASLALGAIAALSLIATDSLLSGRPGGGGSFWPTVGGCLVVYAALLGGDARERVRNLIVAAVLVALVLAGGRDAATIAVGLTCGLAIVRTGLEARARTARGWLREGLLGCAALVFASGLLSPGVLGGALAFWGFALVQSLFFLLPPPRDEASSASEGDAFERARAQLLSLLGDA